MENSLGGEATIYRQQQGEQSRAHVYRANEEMNPSVYHVCMASFCTYKNTDETTGLGFFKVRRFASAPSGVEVN